MEILFPVLVVFSGLVWLVTWADDQEMKKAYAKEGLKWK